MFLAIINDTYSDIKNEIQQDSVPVGEFVSRKFNHYWNKFCPCENTENVHQTRKSHSTTTEPELTQQIDVEPLPNSYNQIPSLESRFDILENELRKIVGRIDTFIKNVTHSVNNEEDV